MGGSLNPRYETEDTPGTQICAPETAPQVGVCVSVGGKRLPSEMDCLAWKTGRISDGLVMLLQCEVANECICI
uniref:Uncharacterized protein n=1 Tax=Physcomitrium patens TaxID=3218 RepID=A0A2K1L6Z6_PHYPA|nr:hypothetical protein PHYPA_000233 [Physcomitrium patens]